MGFIDSSGIYHKESPAFNSLVDSQTSVWKQSDHDRQRADHKWELTQPYNSDGTPNQSFIEAYPEESEKVYKFIPSDEEIARSQKHG